MDGPLEYIPNIEILAKSSNLGMVENDPKVLTCTM